MATQPYRLADQTIRKLNRLALRRVEQAKHRLIVDGFDELNVTKRIDTLYADMDADNRIAYAKLFRERYREVATEDDDIDDLVEMYLTGILSEPNDITHFVYDTEILRKRDRAKEAINSVAGKAIKQIELDKALRLWSQTSQQYADIVFDVATIEAFKSSGVKRVMWNTQNDGRVCRDCDELSGKVFAISNIPNKKHWRCRCYLTAVK